MRYLTAEALLFVLLVVLRVELGWPCVGSGGWHQVVRRRGRSPPSASVSSHFLILRRFAWASWKVLGVAVVALDAVAESEVDLLPFRAAVLQGLPLLGTGFWADGDGVLTADLDRARWTGLRVHEGEVDAAAHGVGLDGALGLARFGGAHHSLIAVGGDPFQDDLAAGLLGAEVEADQEASEMQGAMSAAREVDELLRQGNEPAVVGFSDRLLDGGVLDESTLGSHPQKTFVTIGRRAAWCCHPLPRSKRAASSAGTALRNGRMRERPWRVSTPAAALLPGRISTGGARALRRSAGYPHVGRDTAPAFGSLGTALC
ncbi:hypothetical protein ACFZDK_11095 [Streptomyces sp. NPDC007901]|uniref:hypothetical protein n=1 Tax=Streptomyces sp. NPDC007901 TaxID=3364785 RepID=UPI0036E2BB13